MIPIIVRYLVQGVPQKQIADIMGCSEGYVSQIANREDFKDLAEIAKKDIVAEKADGKRQDSYLTLEDKIIAKLTEDLPFAEYAEAVKLLEILNRRSGKIAPTPVVQDNRQINVVNLNLPAVAVPELILSDNNEVMGIGDKSLAPMAASGVRNLFASLKKKQDERLAMEKAINNEDRPMRHRTITQDEM